VTSLRRFLRVLWITAAAVLLVACGEQFSSPAAVVNGTEISLERLRREVEVGLALTGTAPTQEAPSDFTRQVLGFLIQFHLVAEFAKANDVAVTAEEVDEAVHEIMIRLGSREAFEEALASRGLSLDAFVEDIEMRILIEKVGVAVFERGIAPPEEESEGPQGAVNPIGVRMAGGSRDQQLAFRRWMEEQLRSSNIEVNPRFGRLDLSTGAIVAIRSTADLE
jgi:SurA N-terminal domain